MFQWFLLLHYQAVDQAFGIHQLIVEQIVPTKVAVFEEYETLNDTKRGNSGFGSSDMNSFS